MAEYISLFIYFYPSISFEMGKLYVIHNVQQRLLMIYCLSPVETLQHTDQSNISKYDSHLKKLKS